jgi:hypothetical protein
MKSINWKVAGFTTRLLLMVLGAFYVVSFESTLKPFWLILSILFIAGFWLTFYKFFAEMYRRGAQWQKQ